jgi:CPA2 family monovalent cation:H+ antiporter-2
MGLGLAQLGELSFVLLSEGLHANLVSEVNYNRMLFVAMGTLILTPQLLKFGLRCIRRRPPSDPGADKRPGPLPAAPREAIVIGLGPIGRQAASQLEIMGIDVCLIALSLVNLHAYAQQGFRTVSGDGVDPEVLNRAEVAHARLGVVCVPDDRIALQIVKTLCRLNPQCAVVVRCPGQRACPAKAGSTYRHQRGSGSLGRVASIAASCGGSQPEDSRPCWRRTFGASGCTRCLSSGDLRRAGGYVHWSHG